MYAVAQRQVFTTPVIRAENWACCVGVQAAHTACVLDTNTLVIVISHPAVLKATSSPHQFYPKSSDLDN